MVEANPDTHVDEEEYGEAANWLEVPGEERGGHRAKAEQEQDASGGSHGPLVDDGDIDPLDLLTEIKLLSCHIRHSLTIPQGVYGHGHRAEGQYARWVSILRISEEVQEALAHNRPVVALESTIIAHGLPRPDNLVAALRFENQIRDAGAIPATVAVIAGIPTVGLSAAELELIATQDIAKASVRDLPIVAGTGISGATTVASTAYLAAMAGVRVFATGGLGGVHRGAADSFDESADIPVLATTPITVVSAGVKSILDIGATLERMETSSIPVLGYQTSVFPAFWLRESPYALDWRVESGAEVAQIMAARDALDQRSGIVVANPVPADQQWNPLDHDRILEAALAAADAAGIRGKAVTPFVLSYVVEHSEGASLRVNLDLVANNVRVATEIAHAWAAIAA